MYEITRHPEAKGIRDEPHPFDPGPVTFPSKAHPRGDNALAVRHADRNERKHERLVLVQVDEVHGNRVVYRGLRPS